MIPLETVKQYAGQLKLGLLATLFCAHAHGQTLASDSQRELLLSTLWIQSAPEYKLSTTQTLLQAQRYLRTAVRQAGTAAMEQTRPRSYRHLPPAVIVDIDETMLDNSDYQGYLLRSAAPWTVASWEDWVSLGQARAVPGAVEFANAVVKAGVAIFYVSNRECLRPGHCPGKLATMENMKKLGFPHADKSTVFMFRKEKPDWYGDKVSRRAAIAARYRIVMLVGDDMQDFMAASDLRRYRDHDAGIAAVVNKNLGRRWFILPNPMYGSWEQALPDTVEQKYRVLRAAELQPRAVGGAPD